jgi:hypothetical protein
MTPILQLSHFWSFIRLHARSFAVSRVIDLQSVEHVCASAQKPGQSHRGDQESLRVAAYPRENGAERAAQNCKNGSRKQVRELPDASLSAAGTMIESNCAAVESNDGKIPSMAAI